MTDVFREADYNVDDPTVRITIDYAIEFGVGCGLLLAHLVEDALENHLRYVRAHEWRTRAVLLRLPNWMIDAVANDDCQSPIRELQNRLEALLFDKYRDCAPDAVTGLYMATARRGEKP